MKRILFVLSLCVFSFAAKAQVSHFEQMVIFHQCTTTEWNDPWHPIHRTPPRECSLPDVYFDNASSTIAFVGGEGGSAFTYYILDAAGNILLTSPLTLASDEEANVSLATLSPATYTIVLYINGRYYEGEIEL